MTSVWVVIAAFNEEHKIAEVIEELNKEDYADIVVVDDGSSDDTAKVAAEHRAKVVSLEKNQGQGFALKTGIDFALQNGADIVVTFDADGQHRAEDIPRLVEPIIVGDADVVLGNRFMGKTNIPFIKRIILKVATIIIWVFYGVKLGDAHNGLRALSRRAAGLIQITEPRMAHASEIISEIARHKLAYKEVPVTIRYTDYSKRKGQSVFNSFRILWRMIVHKFKRA